MHKCKLFIKEKKYWKISGEENADLQVNQLENCKIGRPHSQLCEKYFITHVVHTALYTAHILKHWCFFFPHDAGYKDQKYFHMVDLFVILRVVKESTMDCKAVFIG